MTPRDYAYESLYSERGTEDRAEIRAQCFYPDGSGFTEAIDRAFMAGVEYVYAQLSGDERACLIASIDQQAGQAAEGVNDG